MQLVQHAFNKDELSGTSIWQQCCVAAVLDGGWMAVAFLCQRQLCVC